MDLPLNKGLKMTEMSTKPIESDLEDDAFHIIHKAIMLINEGRTKEEELSVLDGEIYMASKIIAKEDLNRIIKGEDV